MWKDPFWLQLCIGFGVFTTFGSFRTQYLKKILKQIPRNRDTSSSIHHPYHRGNIWMPVRNPNPNEIYLIACLWGSVSWLWLNMYGDQSYVGKTIFLVVMLVKAKDIPS